MLFEYLTLFSGLAACLCCLLAHLLALRHWLSAKQFRVSTWQTIHWSAGLASVPLVLWHTGLDWGWWYGIGSWVAADYCVIMLSGCVTLFTQKLIPLRKYGTAGKALIAADLIELGRKIALQFHISASAAFWPLVFAHVAGKLFY